jgi:signal transduction histidine kinase
MSILNPLLHGKFLRPQWATCVFFFLFLFNTKAQSPAEKGLPFITNYPAKEYEAHPQNWAIMEDDKGIMYFGNSICLLEYDGVKWRRINLGVNRAIRSLEKDKNGRMYYGSYGDFGYIAPDSLGSNQERSLLKYVPAAFRNFNDVWTALATDDGIYFQSREKIFRLKQKSSGANEKWECKVWQSPNKFMYAFYLDGTYYVHQQGVGLLKMIADSLRLIPGSEFIGKERMQVMLPYTSPKGGGREGARKQYLIGLFYSGLYIYDGKTFTRFTSEADPMFKEATLYKGALLNDGSYALSTTGKGLVRMDTAGKILQLINREVGLQDESVYTVFSDKTGSLWLGLDNGISRVEIFSPFTQFTIQSGITTAALSAARFEGTIYLGTTNGVIRFNRSNSKFELITDIPANQIFDLVPDDKKLLVSSDGLYYIKDNKTHLIRRSISGDLQIHTIYILKNTPGLLLAGLSGGLAIFSKNADNKNIASNKIPGEWHYIGNVNGVTEDIWNIVENADGSIWLGSNNGVAKLSNFIDKDGLAVPQNAHIERFGVEQGLTGGTVHVFSVGDKKFFVSDKSVYRYDDRKNRFVADSSFGPMGFGNDPNEYNMITDYKGRIWINFGRETALAIPQAEGKYRVEKIQFLPFTDRVIYRIFPEENGIVWFATNEGLIRYDEKLEKNYDQSYKTLLRYVKAGQTGLNPDTSAGNQKLSLISYQNNAMRFEYAAPFFDKENKTQYQVWLQGFEKGWSDWDVNYYKEYTNLPEGDYTFHVRAMNIYGKLSEEAVYAFTIQPPWWRTWWAYTIFGLLTLAIIWTFIYFRSRRLRQENLILEEKVADRTVQLKQSLEELKSTQFQLIQSEKMASLGELTAGIAHEIQNPLNFVNNFSEVNKELLAELSEEITKGNYNDVQAIAKDVIENEEKINHHGKRADAIVKGMLQHSKATTAQKEPTDINALADEYLRLTYHGLRAKDKSFNAIMQTDFDESIDKMNIIPQDIGRVLLNLFNNAFYAVNEKKNQRPEGYEPTVQVSTKNENGKVLIKVKDNGIGIPQKVVGKMFQPFFTTKPTGQGTGLGLSLSYDIIKAHGGEIKVETKDGEGSEFIIQLQIPA